MILSFSPDCDFDWTSSFPSQGPAVVSLYPVQGSARALSCPAPGFVEVCCSVAELLCYYPGSGFAGGTTGRPAPAAAVSGASGLGAAPQVLAIYTPECRKGQIEPKPLKTQKDIGQAVPFPQYCVFIFGGLFRRPHSNDNSL